MPCADAWWKFNSIHVRELRSDSSPPRYGQLRWKSLANFAFKDLNLSFEASDPVFNRARDHPGVFIFDSVGERKRGEKLRSFSSVHEISQRQYRNEIWFSPLSPLLRTVCSMPPWFILEPVPNSPPNHSKPRYTRCA